MAGHIKLDRKIVNWEWYQDHNVCRLFIHLLIMANYKEGKWQGHLVKRGQLITGTDSLSKQTSLTVMQIRTCLNKLKKTEEITIKTTSRFSVITICKYDSYQSLSEENNKQDNEQVTSNITIEQQTDNKQITTNKKFKEVKEEKEDTKGVDIFIAFSLPIELKYYWQEWITYKKKQHKFSYKDVRYEAAAVKDLLKISDNSFPTAIEVIKQSIRNGWKGLFPLKVPLNGKPSNNVDQKGFVA